MLRQYGSDGSANAQFINISGNSSDFGMLGNYIVAQSGNAMGGAVYIAGVSSKEAPMYITDNTGVVSFQGNSAVATHAKGGAICAEQYSPLTITGNTIAQFVSNYVQSKQEGGDLKGGALYFANGSAFKVADNGQVNFQGNAEICSDGTTRLRSVYADLTNTNANSFEWSAPDEGIIVVGDSITLINNAATNKQLVFNNHGGIATGGTLLFSGENTEKALAELKKGGTATQAEIDASRTSVIEGATVKMESGMLAITDSAKLLIHGKTEADSSEFSSMDMMLQAGDLIIQDSEATYFTDMTLSLSRSFNNLGTTSHLIGTTTEEGGDAPNLVVDGTLEIIISAAAGADDTAAFLAVDGFNLELDCDEVNLYMVGFDLSDPDMRYDLFDFSHAGTGWDQLLTAMGDTFSLNGVEYSTAEYLHYDEGDGKLYYQKKNEDVPEPAASLLGIAALAALAGRRRRFKTPQRNTTI